MTNEKILDRENGLLSGLPVKWDPAEDDRRRQAEREQEAAAQRAAERIQQTRNQIGALWAPGLENELTREAAISQNPQIDKDWQSFKDYCAKWGFQSLPAPAEAVVAFLGQSKPKIVSRLYRSIKTVHSAYYDDPTDDILVRALVRHSRTEKKTTPQNNKGH
jgi:hypothetical protein